ncbi:MAG: endonuclease III [Candidatus Dojkabacteria bacterium]|nr:endonuclease III [Candidatus Dojkabacteria bacterium]MDQ7021855.1 endonuclease III [Candidatus Dojkabacteria bacterium]
MRIKDKAEIVLQQLKKDYPRVDTPLIHNNAYEILIATILSPQTPDDTTNKVTPSLFKTYPRPLDLASADREEVLEIIRSVNYNKTKSSRIIGAADMLHYDYNSKVPHQMDELLKFPGVGRKVANVVISEWYAKKPYHDDSKSDLYNTVERGSILPVGFVVDTHVLRVSRMLGFTKSKDPVKVEQDLMKLFPREEWNDLSLRFIFHGREINTAENPKIEQYTFWKDVYGV